MAIERALGVAAQRYVSASRIDMERARAVGYVVWAFGPCIACATRQGYAQVALKMLPVRGPATLFVLYATPARARIVATWFGRGLCSHWRVEQLFNV